MPEIFGSPYLLPAIIVVVLVLLMLLVYLTRRGRPETPAETGAARQPAGLRRQPQPAQDAKAVPHTSPAPAPAAGPETGTPDADMEAPAATPASAATAASIPAHAAPAPAATSVPAPQGHIPGAGTPSVPRPIPPRGGASPLHDPLLAVIMDILNGRGDLGDEDAKRLEVFRPEKILETSERIVLPRDHRLAEQARARLAHIRDIALDAQLRVKPPDVVVAAEVSETVDSAPAGPAVAAADLAEPVTAAGPSVTRVPVTSPVPLVTPRPTPFAPLKSPDEEALLAPPAEPSAAPVWKGERAGPPLGEPPPPEGTPTFPAEAPVVQAVPPRGVGPPFGTDAAVPPIARPVDDIQPPREDSLSDLRVNIKTAADLFTLPAAQRVDMLAFLEPAQLSRVFDAADDIALKKGVIDTLEHVGNPSALGVLRRCLDDPDPEVQLYALEAADRLLGPD